MNIPISLTIQNLIGIRPAKKQMDHASEKW